MAASVDRIAAQTPETARPPWYQSANPPLVRQSAVHRGLVDEIEPWLKLASPPARKAVREIARCGTWNGLSRDRHENPIRYRCGNRTCPSCGRRWRDRTAKTQQGQVETLLAGEFGNARRVTLNFRKVADADVPFIVQLFRDLLSKHFEKQSSLVLVGGFDFAFDSDKTVNAHVHGTFIDVSGNIETSVAALEKEFNEERCFCAQELSGTLKGGRNGPLAWHSYAMDSSVTAHKHQRASSWDTHALITVADKLRWIGLFENLRNAKGNRIRTTIGFGRMRALKRLKRANEEEE